MIFLSKCKPITWAAVTMDEKKAKEAKAPKLNVDKKSDDPQASMMELMKQLYEEGNKNLQNLIVFITSFKTLFFPFYILLNRRRRHEEKHRQIFHRRPSWKGAGRSRPVRKNKKSCPSYCLCCDDLSFTNNTNLSTKKKKKNKYKLWKRSGFCIFIQQ